jgi:deoxyribodipyrimidine photo-lyase
VTTIVWFRNDLRLADNPALAEAAARGPVVPVYVWAPEEEGEWPPGAASRWWLHRSLHALDRSLRERGSQLVVRRGPTNNALASLLRETGAVSVVWNRRYEPAAIARDTELKRRLPEAASFGAGLLREPWTVATRAGGPYQVFTPFWRALQALGEPAAPSQWPPSLTIEQLGLRPALSWDAGLAETWTPGEPGAHDRLEQFRDHAAGYDRDHPSRATSRLSPHLHFGEISPRQAWRAVRDAAGEAATFPPHPRNRFVPPTPACLGATTRPVWRRGSAAAPATRWLTPACASCGRPAGCTTGCGWWRPRS